MERIRHIVTQMRVAMLATGFIILAFVSCDTIREDLEPCGFRLKFKYDYNMQFTDLFAAEVERVDVFVYDSDGTFVFSRTAAAPEISSPSYAMDLSGLPHGKYHIVVWAGLSGDYVINQHEVMKNKVLTLAADTIHGKQDPIWHEFMTDLEYHGNRPQTETASLIRNVNDFTIILHQSGYPIQNPGNMAFEIIAGSCHYDHQNLPVQRGMHTYQSMQPTRDEAGNLAAEVSTMRLFEGTNALLKVYYRDTGATVAAIDLMKYIRMLYENNVGERMSFSEYLDREYQFTVELIYDYKQQLALGIIINGWVVWFNKTEL